MSLIFSSMSFVGQKCFQSSLVRWHEIVAYISWDFSSFFSAYFLHILQVWWAPFTDLYFQFLPKIFNRIQVSWLARPLKDTWAMGPDLLSCLSWGMLWIIVLLKRPTSFLSKYSCRAANIVVTISHSTSGSSSLFLLRGVLQCQIKKKSSIP